MDRLVEASVNASVPVRIDGDVLAACLQGAEPIEPWLAHVQAFFTELPVDAIEAFAAEHAISLEALRRAYEAMKQRTGDHDADVDEWFRYLEAPARPGADGP